MATKVEGLAGGPQWSTPVPVERSLPKGQVIASCEASLRALGLDAVDCLQLHAYWPTWGVEGYWLDELRDLKQQGKARTIGISVPDHRSDMVLPIVLSGAIDYVQTVINIFDPLALENLVPICQQHRVAVIARCILDEGGLTGVLRETTFERGDFRYGYFDDTTPRSVYIAKVKSLQVRARTCKQPRGARPEIRPLASGGDDGHHINARASLREHEHSRVRRAAAATRDL